MSIFSRKVAAIPLSSIDASSLTGTYQALNAGGLPDPCFILRFENASTSDVTISFDGTTDNEFLPGTAAGIPRENLELNFLASPGGEGLLFFPKGTVIYVKGNAGVGTFNLSGYYQNGDS